jgi:hypothetical protein
MCTVSFFKDKDQIIITSNRDENINRPPAIPPKLYQNKDVKLFYPKDPKAGGTWFVLNNNGNLFVLLNGAKFKHITKPPYRQSRGLIILKLAASLDFDEIWKSIELTNIEPFTIIAYVNYTLTQVRWDGKNKEIEKFNNTERKIWSSSTLYSPKIIRKREEWFDDFINSKQRKLTAPDFISFHTKTKKQNSKNGLIINRDMKIVTQSVTQCVIKNNTFKLNYFDLIEKTKIVLAKY